MGLWLGKAPRPYQRRQAFTEPPPSARHWGLARRSGVRVLTRDRLLEGASSEESGGRLPAEPLQEAVTFIHPAGRSKAVSPGSRGCLSRGLTRGLQVSK